MTALGWIFRTESISWFAD